VRQESTCRACRDCGGQKSVLGSVVSRTPIAITKAIPGMSSALPTGFSETFEHMGVLFWPKPGRAFTDLKVERGRRDCDGFLIGPATAVAGPVIVHTLA
jgi:hypothetical protein